MKICVMSDTHRSQRFIQIMRQRINDIKPDLLLHLGDYYDDADAFLDAAIPLVRVPGTWTEYYQNPLIDNRRIETWCGWRVLLTHTPEHDRHDLNSDPDPQELIRSAAIDLCLHGHLHKPDLHQKGTVWILNPGHLYEDDNRGYPATYAVLTLTDASIHVRVIELESGTLFLEKKIDKNSL